MCEHKDCTYPATVIDNNGRAACSEHALQAMIDHDINLRNLWYDLKEGALQ